MIILCAVIFVTACRSSNPQYSSSGEIKSISSEDQYAEVTKVGEIIDQESGQRIYLVTKK